MKKKLILSILIILKIFELNACRPDDKDKKLITLWGETVTPDNIWQSYPRPKLQRETWQNLNGIWEYAITHQNTERKEVNYEGNILVPFAAESSLSGVHRPVSPDDILWYRRDCHLSPSWKGKSVLLHFGAVDYACRLWINGKYAGYHKGGNNPFTFDITQYLKKGQADQKIELAVTDPTDTESITRGKQQLNPNGIWYTPVTGIWKTVWLEAVNREHITQIYPQTDIYNSTVVFNTETANKGNETLDYKVYDKGQVIASATAPVQDNPSLIIPDAELWTPDTPHLYNVKITLKRNGKIIDEIKSYFAFRKISISQDSAGYQRITLNDKPIFQYGTLDQGWWPDGLLTPPSEEAMIWDMIQLKNMGFNTVRKHIKVEPELYYHYADSLGLMVWQDMVSGFASHRRKEEGVRQLQEKDWDASEEHSQQWKTELYEMIDNLKFYPSITTWVIFNEGWGQHNTRQIVNDVMAYDKTHLVNGVSGWADRKVGHFYDVHNYPAASMKMPENTGGRISVLGEFGGFGLPLEGHIWNPGIRNWGYKDINGTSSLIDNYSSVVYDLETLIAQGLAAAIYTQTTDVEGEVNGLLTYDRKIVKMPIDMMHRIHGNLYTIEGRTPTILVPDGRCGQGHMKKIIINNEERNEILPISITKNTESYHSCYEFCVNKEFKHLSLFLNLDGIAHISINGKTVMDETVKLTLHYSQFNLSDFCRYLKPGKRNIIEIDVKNSGRRKVDFDYGLRAW